MEVKVGDKYVLHSKNGMNYCISIVNVSEYRCREERYGAYICDENGNCDKDIFFFDDNFLTMCKKIN